MSELNLIHKTPLYIDLLSAEDQIEFTELQNRVGSPDNRYNRNKRLATLNESFDLIKRFCAKGDEDDWKRYLVCGICWVQNGIAINTRQLRVLIAKSKSTINGALAKMGYATVPTKGEDASQLLSIIPYLKGHFSELRQWTIRKYICFMSPKPELITKNESTHAVKEEKIQKEENSILNIDNNNVNFEFDAPSDFPEFDFQEYIHNNNCFTDDNFGFGGGMLDSFDQKPMKTLQFQFFDESNTITF